MRTDTLSLCEEIVLDIPVPPFAGFVLLDRSARTRSARRCQIPGQEVPWRD